MKHISLYSSKRSVLKYWNKHIFDKYDLKFHMDLSALYNDLNSDHPEVILMDYNGEIENAIELLEYISSKKLGTRIMLLNSHPIFSEGIRLLRKDARSYMNAYAKPENLNQAIEAVLEGNIWLYPEFIQAMIKQSLFSHVEQSKVMQQISSRQLEIAEMVALGMSNKEIAKHADITEQTVKTHLKTIYEKLDVNTRLELAIMINKVANSYQSGIANS